MLSLYRLLLLFIVSLCLCTLLGKILLSEKTILLVMLETSLCDCPTIDKAVTGCLFHMLTWMYNYR